ncbi:MutS-related protein [Flavobacterium subsaxonicum]|uniref:DNA mismatch repair protein n=1 Tax=Flavobacterium subsaxonicum WB 4.1-42 = DSM 21790 TaxID=1121898 RepID=A0A0A2MQM6_9FLAO|nr:DNA mismatch repair protein [Flavobacterium subsaxonicum]KGO94619.1 DNA mismatch repair protein [Flavobacterium subsaxonicum WB 4.1-42 = DSM 21790]
MEFYSTRKAAFVTELNTHKSKYNTISAARLVVAIAFLILGFYSIKSEDSSGYVYGMLVCAIAFFVLMRLHTAVSQKKERAAALVKVNEQEIAYLSGTGMAFANGAEFTDYTHPYSHDLDIFGERSLFQNLNRTETFKGKQKLADLLLNVLPQTEILKNQLAIKELAAKPEWRQEVMALGKTNKDGATVYNKLMGWVNNGATPISNLAGKIAIIAPVALVLSLIAYVFTDNDTYLNAVGYLIGFNLIFILGYVKFIKNEINDTTEIHTIIHNYSQVISQLENEEFESEKLQSLQAQLISGGQKASTQIKKLAVLFSQMDTVSNVIGAAFFNGLFLYHFHILKALLNWKKDHAQNVNLWLDTIAEAEALSSFANLYYNNPDFTFPTLNTNNVIAFKDLAHPLIKKQVRVGNTINFNPGFTILTGSNMSGKSTFLRSLGINMVLAGAGAPVCASAAVVHPLPVLVSMRLSDSLSDSESYFFAEIKRLRQIMDALQNQRAFVLLDEILRGTNSDDKQMGTIKVIKRMMGFNAVGAIATHDIEVCDTTLQYPESLVNRCFEVQIIDNELYFDYQLRDGICKNKSATFIMEKMGVV